MKQLKHSKMNKILLLLVFVVFSCLKSFAQPVNDDCSNAIAITCGATDTGSTATATIDTAPVCGPSLSITAPGVWYTFVGTGDAITASLCGSAFDTKIIVYSGSCGSLTCVAGNDDAGGACPSMGLNSIAYFNSVSGTNYYILVTGFGSGTGAYTLNIGCAAPCLPVPANDDCSGAILLAVAVDVFSCSPTTGTNTCANNSLINPSCVPFASINDVWFQFNTGTNTGITMEFDAITGADTYSYALYTSCGGTEIGCGALTTGSITTISGLTASTTYFLQIFNNGGLEAGTFSLCLYAPPGPPIPPPNDDCTGITPTTLVNGAAPVTFTGTTYAATYDAAFSTIVVWEAVTLTECGNLQIDYCGTNPSVMQSALIYYTACPVAGFTAGTYDVTTCSDGNVTFYFYNLPAGTYYLPVLGGTPNTPGPYIMNAQSFDCTTSIVETAETKKTLLYPNPAADVLNIKGVFGKEATITIIDALGKVLLTEIFNSAIDISSLSNGVYIVQIQAENYKHYERFVKAK